MSQFEPNDLFLVNRNDTSYKVPFEILQENLGGGNGIQPQPTQIFATPNFIGGNGSQSTPFVISSAESFLNGETQSEQEITIVDQEGSTSAFFEDLNGETNGIRFNQPPMSTSTSGVLVFRMQFSDIPESPQTSPTYTGLIKLGKTYFTWDVTVANRGVKKPTINTITSLSGDAVSPPRFPSYTSPPSPVVHVEFTAEYTGLNPNLSVVIPVSGGSGQNCQVTVKTSPTGELLKPVIYISGQDYVNNDSAFIDLTSVGGASVACNLYTDPQVGITFIADVSAYETVFGGGFLKSEWLFSSSPNFDAGDETTYENTDPATSISIPHGRTGSTVNFVKVRNISVDDIASPYSDAVQFATAALVLVNYDLTDWSVSPKSFNSGDVNVIAYPGTAWTINGKTSDLNTQGTSTGGNGGSDNGSCCVGGGGSSAQVQVLLQTRQVVAFKVLTLNGSGGVSSVEQVKTGFGSQDRYMNESATNVPPLTGGTGSGCEILIKRDANNQTVFRSIKTAGTGYTIGDILEITPEYGTGNKTLQDLDSEWDVLLNGLGGNGGNGAGGESSSGGTKASVTWSGSNKGTQGGYNGVSGGAGGNGGSSSGSLYPDKGANGTSTGVGGGGGGGGNGWGGGSGGGRGNDAGANKSSGGGGGGSGYSYVNPMLEGYSTTNTTFGQKGYIISLNSVQIETNNANELRVIPLS